MLNAGDLDRRLALLRPIDNKNAFNEAEKTFVPVATVWASKQDVSDAERARAAEAGATITTRFRVRWSDATAAVGPTWRVRCEGLTYDVAAVKEIGRREGREITGTARADLEPGALTTGPQT